MNNTVKVEGELVVRDGSGIMQEFYEEEFVLDDSIDKNEARALIKKGLITDRLIKKVEGFKKVRTLQVVSMTPTEEPEEESELSKIMLKAIELNCVPVNIDNYKRPDYKIKALEKAIETQKNRKPPKSNTQNLGVVDD